MEPTQTRALSFISASCSKMFGKRLKEEEDERLLKDTEALSQTESTESITSEFSNHAFSQWLSISLFINAVLIALCLYLFTLQKPALQSPFPQHIYCKILPTSSLSCAYWQSSAPAQDALAYKTVIFHSNSGNDTTIYQKPPSEEVDAAWEDLYRSTVTILLIKQSWRRFQTWE